MSVRAAIRTVFWTLTVLMAISSAVSACPPQIEDRFAVPATDWILETWVEACGFGVSGGMEIRATNDKTRERIVIATFDDIEQTQIAMDGLNRVAIALPNRSLLNQSASNFGDVQVVYRFLPKDDPDDRANYQKWRRSPGDPQSREWYCETILAKMDPVNRASWNRIIGESFPAVPGQAVYCPSL